MFRPIIRSKHTTHTCHRKDIPRCAFRYEVSFGSVNPPEPGYLRLNTPEAVGNARDKLLMKQCFDREGVKTAKWSHANKGSLKLPVVAKHRTSSRGEGVYLLKTQQEYDDFLRTRARDLDKFIFEKYKNYHTEFRLHVHSQGYFYTCRKAMRRATPGNRRWKFTSDETVWLLETNPHFNRPTTWDQIVEHSIKSLRSVGLDTGAVDVKVGRNGRFCILEINSAPAFGDLTAARYMEILPQVAQRKYDETHTVVSSTGTGQPADS